MGLFGHSGPKGPKWPFWAILALLSPPGPKPHGSQPKYGLFGQIWPFLAYFGLFWAIFGTHFGPFLGPLFGRYWPLSHRPSSVYGPKGAKKGSQKGVPNMAQNGPKWPILAYFGTLFWALLAQSIAPKAGTGQKGSKRGPKYGPNMAPGAQKGSKYGPFWDLPESVISTFPLARRLESRYTLHFGPQNMSAVLAPGTQPGGGPDRWYVAILGIG